MVPFYFAHQIKIVSYFYCNLRILSAANAHHAGNRKILYAVIITYVKRIYMQNLS